MIIQTFIIPAYLALTTLIELHPKKDNVIWTFGLVSILILSILFLIAFLADLYDAYNFDGVEIIYMIGNFIAITAFSIIIVEGLLRQFERKSWIVIEIFLLGLMIIGFTWIIENKYNKRLVELQYQINQLKNV